jgi:hypothetical protein
MLTLTKFTAIFVGATALFVGAIVQATLATAADRLNIYGPEYRAKLDREQKAREESAPVNVRVYIPIDRRMGAAPTRTINLNVMRHD